MANEFIVRNGLVALADSQITGSLSVSGAITGSGAGLTNIPSSGLNAPGSDTQILFNSDGSLAASSGLVYSGSRLGIGTTSPDAQLHLVNNQGSWDRHISIEYDASNIANILVDTEGLKLRNMSSGNNFYFRNSDNNTQLFISSSGVVGIGTTTPTQRLEVRDGNILVSGSTPRVIFENAALAYDHDWFLRNDGGSGQMEYRFGGGAKVYFNNHSIRFGDWGAGTGTNASTQDPRIAKQGVGALAGGLQFFTNNTARMSISGSTGYVGIGTTTPLAPLDVNGNIYSSGNLLVDTIFSRGGSSNLNLDGRAGYGVNIRSGSRSIAYFDYDTGNVGIGTTTPSTKLHVSGTSDVLLVEGSGSTIFDVQGSQGQLFSVTDSLVGSLFSVNDISGLPIIEVFDTDKVVMGTFGQNTLVVTGSNVGVGTDAPTARLHVRGEGTTSSTYAAKFTDSTGGNIIYMRDDGVVVMSNGYFYVDHSDGIYSNGSIKARGGVTDDGGNLGLGGHGSIYNLTLSGSGYASFNGNVGIGVTNPGDFNSNASNLVVGSGAGSNGITIYSGASSTGGLYFADASGSGAGNRDGVINYLHGDATMEFKTGGNQKVLSIATGTSTFHMGNVVMENNLTVKGRVTAEEFHTEFVSASIIYQSGSTKFGDTSDDIHQFTGSVNISAASNYGVRIAAGNALIGGGASGGDTQLIYWGGDVAYYGRGSLGGTVDQHEFRTGGTTRLTVSSSGYVGIGTTSPSRLLHVNGTMQLDGGVIYSTASSLTLQNTGGSWLTLNARGLNIGDFVTNPTYGDILIGAYDFDLIKSGSENLLKVVNSTGNVGIGTTNPLQKLHVAGNVSASYFYGDGSGLTNVTAAAPALQEVLNSGNSAGGVGIEMQGGGIDMGAGDITGAGHISGSTMQLGSTAYIMGNVGIGETSPAAKLHVHGGTVSGAATTDILKLQAYTGDFGADPAAIALAFKFQDSNNLTNEARIRMATVNDTDYGDNDEAASNLIFSTTDGGAESDKMIITGRGAIGIGTNNPGYLLHLEGGTLGVKKAQSTTAFTDPFLKLFPSSTTNTTGLTTITLGTSPVDNYGVSLSGWRYGTDGTPKFVLKMHTNSAAGTDALTVDYLGNVGIGTTSPSEKLHVDGGNIKINNSTAGTTPGVYISNTGLTGNQTQLYSDITGTPRSILRSTERALWIQANSSAVGGAANDLRLYTNGNLGLAVDHSGSVGIGTTTPSKTLYVNGTFQASGEAFFSHFDVTGANSRIRDDLYLNFGTARVFRIGYNSTTDLMTFGSSSALMTLDGDGNLTVPGIVTAREFHTEFVSASIIYQSGSTKFGDSNDDIHNFTGSVILESNTSTGLYIKNNVTTGGAGIRFSDVTAYSQYGDLVYKHQDGVSEGSDMSWHFIANGGQASVIGDKFIVNSTTVNEPGFSFSGDTDTGFYSGGANTIKAAISGSEKVRIDTNGVGIASGNVYVAHQYKVNFDYGTSNDYFVRKNSSNLEVYSAGNVAIGAASATKVFVSGSGNVGIGTTSPTTALQVVGRTKTSELHVSNGDAIYTNTGNVGIGTTTPAFALTVEGVISGSSNILVKNNVYAGGAAGFVFGQSTSEGEYIYRSGNSIIVKANSSDVLTIDGTNSGVGIGNTAPVGSLRVDSTSGLLSTTASVADYNINLFEEGAEVGTGVGTGIAFTQYASGDLGLYTTYTPGAAIVHERVGSNSQGGLIFRVKPTTTSTGSLTDALYIRYDGNVGIGTTSPGYKLDIDLGSTSDRVNITRGGALKLYIDGNGQLVSYANLVSYGNSLSGGGGMFQYAGGTTGATVGHRFKHLNNSFSNSSGDQTMLEIIPTINQSGTAGYTGIKLNVTETALGSGNKYLMDLQTGGTSKLTVSNNGDLGANRATFASTVTAADITSTGNATVNGNLTVGGIVTAQEFHTEFVSASIIYQSGSTKFGDTSDDDHDFTGSLNIQGDIRTKNSGRLYLWNDNNSNYLDYITWLASSGTTQTIQNTGIGGITFKTLTSTRMYISASGNIGIGTTDPRLPLHVYSDARIANLLLGDSGVTNTPTAPLHIKSSGTNARMRIEDSDNANKYYDFLVDEGRGLHINEDTSTVFFIQEGGNVGINNTSPNYTLDVTGEVGATSFIETSARRFKENIEPIQGSLEIVEQLQGVTFNRIGEEKREYGFIADEVKDVAPELVSYDENGEVHGVHYARTVAVLTEAVKELKGRVKAQDLFIKDLVARIEKLENN